MKKYSIVAGILITVASIVAIVSAWHDSPIVDEVPHIGAGYSYIAGHTYEFNPEHPPLAKDFAGLALLPLHINAKILNAVYDGNWPTDVHGQWNFGRSLIFHSGVDPITIVHVAKLPLILFFIFCSILIFFWTKKYYNPRAALLAVFFFALSPTIIAHSRLVTTDIAALFGVLLATYFFIHWLERRTTASFWIASVTFGIAMLAKFSTFLLVPYFLLAAILWAWTHERHWFRYAKDLIWKTILIFAAGFIIIVGPVYQLHILKYSGVQQKADTIQILSARPIPIITNTLIWAADKPGIRALAQYGLGLTMTFQRAEGGNQTYFLGQLSSSSFKSYFPIVYSLKEPIPFLIFLLCAVWLGFRNWFNARGTFKEKRKERLPQALMLLWILIYLLASINANLNIGIRHLMPIYGFIFILVAGQIEGALSGKKVKKWLLVGASILCLWYIGEFISVYPYYLTYFNEFAGGPAGGHNYVVDSNLDWGQDLWRLGDFVKANHIQKIYTDYFGWADPSFYLGNSYAWMQGGMFTSKDQFLATNPQGGWLAISATFWQEASVRPEHPYAWLAKYTPATVIGHSIFVFHVTP